MGFIKNFGKEFKQFAVKGNVIDMAIGVVVGGAFSKIVSSLVDDVFMPLVGLLTGGFDISSLSIALNDNGAKLMYGKFITTIVDFLLVALCLFMFVKGVNRFKSKPAVVKTEPARICPFCMQNIDKLATRCPHCTSIIE